MKKIYLFAALLVASISFGQGIITKWDFDTSPFPITTSIGTGTLSLIGGVVENTQSGCSCPYVAGNPTTGKAYTTKTYPAQGTNSGTAGIQFSVSTTGQTNINIYVDVYGSSTASKYVQLQYTTNGTDWTNATAQPTIVPHDGTNSQWVTISASMPVAAENNPNFSFRVVAVFDPSSVTSYSAVKSGSTYAATGALRYDNIIVSNGVLSNNKFDNIAGLQVYPNPAKTNLFVTSNSFAEKQVVLYDVLGKVALKAKVTNQPISVTSLPKGVYIAKITEEGKTATRKVVIE